MSSYKVQGKDTFISVSGTLSDNGRVTIMKNGEEYVYDKKDGEYSEDIFPELHCSDGAFIDEGPTKQKIRLPDGTLIEKGVISQKATLPNGEVIESDSDSHESQNTNVSIQSDSSSSNNVNIKVSINNSQVSVNNKNNVEDQDKVNEKIQSKSKTDILTDYLPSPLLATIILTGILFNMNIILFISVFIYLYQISSRLFRDIKRYNNSRKSSNNQPNRIEEIKNQYANGDISEEEFESRLDNYFSNSDEEYNLQYN